MIEAVNSVIANASLLRASVEQVDASRSFAANPESSQVAAIPQAPYISPFIHVDVNYNTAVLQIRDSDTGDVLRTIPSESRLQERYRANQATSQVRVAPVQAQDVNFSAPAPQGTGSPAGAVAALSASVHTPGSTGTTGVTVFA